MLQLRYLCQFLMLFYTVAANSNGPFVLWGPRYLKSVDVSALEGIDDKLLREFYSESKAVVMFLRNATTRLSKENFPSFKEVLDHNPFVYLAQHWLPSDPVDYNLNVEIVNLVGPISQQDIEMTALFRDAESTYGRGNVLGILGSKLDSHAIYRREADDIATLSSSPSPDSTNIPTTEEPMVENYVYQVKGKAMLYTTSPPVLRNGDTNTTIVLKSHGLVTNDERDLVNRLIVSFKIQDNQKLTLRFRFPITPSGYWSLNSVEVEENGVTTNLSVVGANPTAPLGFSYKCSSSLVFQNGTTNLKLENIQVETAMNGRNPFGDAYNCIGFTTAPIWAGVFVSSLLLGLLAVAITCILDIKTPNKFENRSSKQLTFTVQE